MGVLDFGFLVFCVLHLCFQSVETAPKLDLEKTAFVSVLAVFLSGVFVVAGGDHRYIYICTKACMYKYTCTYIYVYINTICVYVVHHL